MKFMNLFVLCALLAVNASDALTCKEAKDIFNLNIKGNCCELQYFICDASNESILSIDVPSLKKDISNGIFETETSFVVNNEEEVNEEASETEIISGDANESDGNNTLFIRSPKGSGSGSASGSSRSSGSSKSSGKSSNSSGKSSKSNNKNSKSGSKKEKSKSNGYINKYDNDDNYYIDDYYESSFEQPISFYLSFCIVAISTTILLII